MALTSTDVQEAAAEGALALLTAFCVSIEPEEIQAEAGEEFFSVLNELSTLLEAAHSPAEKAYARELFATTIIKIAGIVDALLNDCSAIHEIEKFDLLAGIAQTVYGSLQ